MLISDILSIVQWWSLLLIIGIIFLPTTSIIFKPFFDRGYIFAKIFGMVFVSYAIFLFGTLKILPFTTTAIFLILLGLLILNLFILVKVTPGLRWNLVKSWKIFLFEEILFLSTLIFWSYIRAHQPDIHGLEKFMDFGFVNSILRSDSLPPKDMWFTPLPINYYYFGHLVTAVLTKLSGIPSQITYNLMLATIFALTFTETFSIGANLINSLKKSVRGANKIFSGRIMDKEIMEKKNAIHLRIKKIFVGDLSTIKIILAGLLTAFLVTLAGNLHPIYTLFKPYLNDNPVPFWQLTFSPSTFPNSYWYPNATRFIYNTIHEFPSYSWVVADLHGHVLDIPLVLLTIAVLFSIFLKFNYLKLIGNLLLISFLLAVMYMTNAWDGLIYALLTLTVFVYLAYRSKNYTLYAIRYTLIIIGFFLFSLPFNLNFKPFVSGIGVLCAPAFLTNIGKVGPFLFEADHCQRSPLYQLFILYGFFYFWIITFFLMFIKKKNSNNKARNPKWFDTLTISSEVERQYQNPNVQNTKRFGNLIFKNLNLFRVSSFEFRVSKSTDIFVLILILLSTALILLPEFIYIKDIYPAHYRANTMFKLVYQAFIMLSLSSVYIIVRIVLSTGKLLVTCYLLLATFLIFIVSIYPYFAINSYYGDLKTYYGLDGISYLKKLYPTDYQAVLWLNKNVKGQPVILEAQGDSYTDFARVSANTGLPTVLGWAVHEWLWRGTYDIPAPRIPDIQALYEDENINQTKILIKKYNIDYVFVGSLERQKYTKLNEEKFKTLGKIVYKNDLTKIYKINL